MLIPVDSLPRVKLTASVSVLIARTVFLIPIIYIEPNIAAVQIQADVQRTEHYEHNVIRVGRRGLQLEGDSVRFVYFVRNPLHFGNVTALWHRFPFA